MRYFFLLGICIFFASTLNAQRPIDTLFHQAWRTVDTSFYTVDSLSEVYFTGIDTTTDSVLLKQHKFYMRWAWFAESRLDSLKTLRTYRNKQYKSVDGSGTFQDVSCSDHPNEWEAAGPFSPVFDTPGITQLRRGVGRADCIDRDHTDPTGNTIFIGSNSGGLFKTTDRGQTWTNITENIRIPNLGINDVAVHPTDPDIILIVSWSGNNIPHVDGNSNSFAGVWRTTNGGTSWTRINPMVGGTTYWNNSDTKAWRVKFHAHDPSIVYAAIDAILWKSTDAGITWSSVADLSSLSCNEICYMEIGYTHPNININNHNVYFSTIADGSGCAARLVRYNAQNTFVTDITPSIIDNECSMIEIGTTPSDPLAVYMLTRTGSASGNWNIWKSEDEGNTWPVGNQVSGTGSVQVGHLRSAFAISPVDENVMYYGAVDLGRKTDFPNGSLAFDNYGGGIHDDFHDILFLRGSAGGSDDTLIVVSDGGVYEIRTDATNRHIMHSGLNITQYYGFDVSRTHAGTMIAGAQDNGTHLYRSTHDDWAHISGISDGGHSLFDPEGDDNRFWTQSPGPNFSVFNNSNWVGSSDYNTTGKLHIHNDSRTLFYARSNGGGQILEYDMDGTQVASAFTTISEMQSIMRCWANSEVDADSIYVGGMKSTWGSSTCDKRIFKVNVNTGAYRDISHNWAGTTNTLAAQNGAVPMDIAVRKFNDGSGDEEEVYIVLGGYTENGKHAKVWKRSSNGTWSDFSANLKGLKYPINAIAIQYGSPNDVLYIGTDYGVYYREITAGSDWECFSNELPSVRVTELKVSRCERKLVASTMSRGLWKVDLVNDLVAPETLVVSSNTTFSGDHSPDAHIRITNGADLTVTGTLHMPAETWITVEPGSKLVVNGGTITNECYGLWNGIQAHGSWNASTSAPWHQFDESKHGVVILQNDARIEHANYGVVLGIVPNTTAAKRGGILRASNSTFLNNRSSVRIHPFRNHAINDATQEVKNRSYITNCTFKTNSAYKADGTPFTHVYLLQVNGVQIKANTFVDSTSWGSRTVDKFHRMGIYAINASFNLDPVCSASGQLGSAINPCFEQAGADSNRFEMMNVGVKVVGFNPAFISSVRAAAFDDNHVGLYGVAANSFECYKNRVQVRDANLSQGVVLDASTGFLLEENNITGYGNAYDYGIQINNSAIQDQNDKNYVRNNTLNDLEYAALLSNDNDGPAPNDGLQYLCNVMENTNNDILIHGKSGNLQTDIAVYQGFCASATNDNFNSTPANDDFSTVCSNQRQLYVIKSSGQLVHYHHLTSDDPSCYTSTKVTLHNCGDLVPDAGVRCVLNEKALPSEIETTIHQLEIDKDGIGDPHRGTDELTEAIDEDVDDAEMMALLAVYSPYIKDDVLSALINAKSTPFDADSLEVILQENAPLSVDVMNVLEEEYPDVYDNIESYVDTMSLKISPRTMLENHHEYLDRQIDALDHEVLRHWMLYDTNSYALDSALAYFGSLSGRAWDKERIYLLFRMEQADSAKSYANQLDNSDNGLDNFLEWVDIMHEFETDTNWIWILEDDTSLENRVRTLADTNNQFAESAFARVLLNVVFGDTFSTPIYTAPEGGGSKTTQEQFFEDFEETNYKHLLIYPNPATDKITVEYELPEGCRQAFLELYSREGRTLDRYDLNIAETRMELDVSYLSQGVYVYILNADGAVIARRKMMISPQ